MFSLLSVINASIFISYDFCSFSVQLDAVLPGFIKESQKKKRGRELDDVFGENSAKHASLIDSDD